MCVGKKKTKTSNLVPPKGRRPSANLITAQRSEVKVSKDHDKKHFERSIERPKCLEKIDKKLNNDAPKVHTHASGDKKKDRATHETKFTVTVEKRIPEKKDEGKTSGLKKASAKKNFEVRPLDETGNVPAGHNDSARSAHITRTEQLENAQVTGALASFDIKAAFVKPLIIGVENDDNSCRDTVEDVASDMEDMIFAPLLFPILPEAVKAFRVYEDDPGADRKTTLSKIDGTLLQTSVGSRDDDNAVPVFRSATRL
ncbi:unnamed protein product [Caenorhabditis auriculariae]|uniref:Uncharacterized protein n=1 Tax=Caenorhabditis auriculariae TaxID=2777116 RepID=A0A8S1GMT5_9PELO|nr:unnamed protein product [Caenorhabditis auriculariae]